MAEGTGASPDTIFTQTQFSSFFFFFWGGGGQGNMAIYFTGTLEYNSLFLGNKTNVRECLKIILRNKADHKKYLCLLYPFLPTYIPPTQHILWRTNVHILITLRSVQLYEEIRNSYRMSARGAWI